MQPGRPQFVMSKCCAFWAQVIAGWSLPLAILLLTWAVFQKVATFFLMTRHTSIHKRYMVATHCWVLEKYNQQFSISIFTRNSPTQALSTLSLYTIPACYNMTGWVALIILRPTLTRDNNHSYHFEACDNSHIDNSHLEGWLTNWREIVWKPHPNYYELKGVFKRKQAVTEVVPSSY